MTRGDIEDVVSRWTGVPITSLKEEETQRLLRVEEELHKRVISQDKAIGALARAIPPVSCGVEESGAGQLAASCSLGLRASERRRWRGRWRSSCLEAKRP